MKRRSVLLMLIFSGTCHGLFSQNKPIDHNTFLSESLPVEGVKLYLLAEDHLFKNSASVRFPLIRSMNEKCFIRNIVMEIGGFEAWLANRFLETGDTSFLANTAGYTMNAVRKFWGDLYSYNHSLHPERRMVIIGLDYDQPGPLKTAISKYFNISPPEAMAHPVLKQILLFNKSDFSVYRQKSFSRILTDLKTDMIRDKAFYLRHMNEDDYLNALVMIDNPINKPLNIGIRGKLMYNNLIGDLTLVPGGVLALCGEGMVRNIEGTFGFYLKNEEYSPYRDKVLIIDTYYYNCTINGKQVKIRYPKGYSALAGNLPLMSLPEHYYWLEAPGLQECDYLFLVINNHEIK
jgi:hypothetical protein